MPYLRGAVVPATHPVKLVHRTHSPLVHVALPPPVFLGLLLLVVVAVLRVALEQGGWVEGGGRVGGWVEQGGVLGGGELGGVGGGVFFEESGVEVKEVRGGGRR